MKKSNQKVQATIDVTPEEAWKVIGGVDGVDQWLPIITACSVEGDKRICSTEEGSFTESILKIDHENRIFKYAIPVQHLMPIENIVGHMKVGDENGQAKVEWEWEYEVEEENDAQAREMLAGAGLMGIEGIEKLIQSRVAA